MNIKTEEIVVQCTVNANFLLKGWLVYYGILMRQAQNGEISRLEVIKACERVLEDLRDPAMVEVQ